MKIQIEKEKLQKEFEEKIHKLEEDTEVKINVLKEEQEAVKTKKSLE